MSNFSSENPDHLDKLEETLVRISGPIDKLYYEGQPSSVPGRDSVNALTDAENAIRSIDKKPDVRTRKVNIDSKEVSRQLQIVVAKLQFVKEHLQNLNKDEIADDRLSSFKQAVFESYGEHMRAKLPSIFERYENLSIIEIVEELIKDIQAEI